MELKKQNTIQLQYHHDGFLDGYGEHITNDFVARFLKNPPRPVKSPKKLKEAFAIILWNLYESYLASNRFKSYCVKFSRNKNWYKGRDPGYKTMIMVIDWLVSQNYCETLCGFYDRTTGRSRLSRLRYTNRIKHQFDLIKSTATPEKTTDHLIRVKTENKEAIPHLTEIDDVFDQPINGQGSQLDKIRTINDVKRRHRFTHLRKNLPRNDIYRVFNNDGLGDGGRFYGEFIQRLPSVIRSEIKIDGQAVVELDFSGLHPQMLYDIHGVAMNGDPYTVPGYERPLIKQAFQRILNNPTKRSAVQSVRRLLTKEPSYRAINPQDLVDAILTKHQTVLGFSDTTGTCVGLQLQRLDSDIALEVMYEFALQNIPCIGIHDSFIVPHNYEQQLRSTMLDKYNEMVQLEFVRQYEKNNDDPCPIAVWRNKKFTPIIK